MVSKRLTGLEFGNYFVWSFVGEDIRNRSEVVVIGHDGRAANGMSGNSMGKVGRIPQGREKPGPEHFILTPGDGDIEKTTAQYGKQRLTSQLTTCFPVRFSISDGNHQPGVGAGEPSAIRGIAVTPVA